MIVLIRQGVLSQNNRLPDAKVLPACFRVFGGIRGDACHMSRSPTEGDRNPGGEPQILAMKG